MNPSRPSVFLLASCLLPLSACCEQYGDGVCYGSKSAVDSESSGASSGGIQSTGPDSNTLSSSSTSTSTDSSSDSSTGATQSGGSTGTSPTCGDGSVDQGEQCDDGPDNGGHRRCSLDCNPPPPACGNQLVESGETCDDGNADNLDDCVACTPAAPADGFINLAAGHVCDDGNSDNFDGCPTSFKFDHHIAFLTTGTVTGAINFNGIGGLDGADALCQSEAQAASLSGVYKAWLSSTKIAARDRLAITNKIRPIYYPRTGMDQSLMMASSWNALLSGDLENAPQIGPSGVKITDGMGPHARVWTNTGKEGTIVSAQDKAACEDWGNANMEALAFSGSSASLDETWTNTGGGDSCASSHPLYCFQTAMTSGTCGDGTVDTSRESCDDNNTTDGDGCPSSCRDEHRLMFVSPALTPGRIVHAVGPDMLVGLAAADRICQTSAEELKLSGTYAAWLSSTHESAYQRLGLPEKTVIRRLDGAQISAGLADAFDGTVGAPISSGSPDDAKRVWTSTRPSGAPASTRPGGACDDWTSAAEGNSAVQGDANALDTDWVAGPEADCSTPAALYCVQTSLGAPPPEK